MKKLAIVILMSVMLAPLSVSAVEKKGVVTAISGKIPGRKTPVCKIHDFASDSCSRKMNECGEIGFRGSACNSVAQQRRAEMMREHQTQAPKK